MRWLVHVVDILPCPVAEHVCGITGANGVVFAENGPILVGIPGDLPERTAGEALAFLRGAGALQHGGKAVHKGYRRVRNTALRNVGTGQDERNRRGFLVHREFPEQAAGAQGFPVVRCIKDTRGVNKVLFVQCVQYPSDLPVQVSTGAVIGRRDVTQFAFGKAAVVMEEPAETPYGGMVGPVVRMPLRGQRERFRKAGFKEFRRRDVGRVGADE